MDTKTNKNGGTRSSAEIQREIDATRAELDSTLSAIESKVSPRNLVDEAVSYVRTHSEGVEDMVSSFASQAVRVAKENPIPIALIGLGIAGIVRNQLAERSSRPRPVHTPVESPREPLTLKERASGAMTSVRGAATRSYDYASTQIHEQPIVLGALGIALGAAIGGALPSTELEDELLGPKRDQVMSDLRARGREAMDRAREAGFEVARVARDQAYEEGILPVNVGEKASEKAGELARETVEKVKRVAHATQEAVKSEISSADSPPTPRRRRGPGSEGTPT